MDELLSEIEKENIGRIVRNIYLKNYTTYKVGGKAWALIYPKDERKLVLLMRLIKQYEVKYKILGNGSNTLFSDKDFDGIIINLKEFNDIKTIRNIIKVGAGFNLIKLSAIACNKGLTGLEFAAGIPGTVGGAVYMNAGAYKSDMGYIVRSVRVLTPDFRIINMSNKEMGFRYRSSFLNRHSGYICLGATITLKYGKRESIEEVIKDRRDRRLESQPLEYPSAGSVFRNPEGMFAGKLIEDLGYKGLMKGDAGVSNKHANFVVNYGNANAQDIKDLIDFLKEEVKDKCSIELKVEQEFVNWE